MTAVRLQHLSKRFGETIAVDDVILDVAAGELFFLLGPSGCGKSTLLRLIAGLHQPEGGEIFFGDQNVTRLETDHRNAVMCFQSYALWPHMTVRDNVRFGLAVRGMTPEDQRKRVDEVLKLVQLQDFASRKPNQLSGGQQQRVALARALAVSPACLLLDEPLSNLDTKLRQEMRGEIRKICKSAGLTTIYVTHDQKEAMSVADRIGLLRDGKLIQVGTPAELYMRPKNSFVAEFMGQTNLLPGTVVGRERANVEVETAAGLIMALGDGSARARVMLSIRPERIKITPDRKESGAIGKNRLAGTVLESTFLGDSSEHLLRVYGSWLRVVSTPPAWGLEGEQVLEFDPHDVAVLPE
jgi:iron(III) transport system ATP-binding protein